MSKALDDFLSIDYGGGSSSSNSGGTSSNIGKPSTSLSKFLSIDFDAQEKKRKELEQQAKVINSNSTSSDNPPTDPEQYKEWYKKNVLNNKGPEFIQNYAANMALFNKWLQNNPVLGRFVNSVNTAGGQQVLDDTGKEVAKPSTGSKIADTAIDIPSNVLANVVLNQGAGVDGFYTKTGQAAENILAKTPVKNNIAKSALKGGLENGIQEGMQSTSRGDSANDIVKNTLEGAGTGLVFGGGLGVAGKGLEKIKGLSKSPTDNINLFNSSLDKNISKANVIAPMEDTSFKMPLKTVGEDIKNPNQINLNESINLKNKDFNSPKMNIDSNIKESQFKNTVMNSDTTSPELQKILKNVPLVYDKKGNVDTLNYAKSVIEKSPDDAIRLAKSDAHPTAESNAISQLLIQKLQKEGKYDDAIDIIKNTSSKATTQGQAIQALSMWGRLTPEGMLRHAQSTFDKANSELSGLAKKAGKKVELTPELVDHITNTMNEINKMPEGYDKLFKTASLLSNIDEKIPKTTAQKLSTVQAMAQLLNPKTIGRNIIGNTMFGGGLENISQVIGTGLDKGISKFTGKRTTVLPSLKTQLGSAREGLNKGIKEGLAGVNTDNVNGKYELGKQGRTFARDTKLGKLETAMNVSLQAPDKASYKAAYDDTLRQLTKASKVDVPTEEMKAYADFTAKYRTFQDDSNMSRLFKGLKDSLNKVGIGKKDWKGTSQFGLGDLVLKYSKTPANILDRALDYSPIGVIKGTVRDAGKIGTQKAFVDAMSRSLTGTGVMFLGYTLAKNGILTSKASDNINEDKFNRQIGENPYSININALKRWAIGEDTKPQQGDKYISWDWAAPTSVMFAMGGDIAQSLNNNKKLSVPGILGATKEGISTGANSFFEQPLFTGIQNITSYGNLPQGITNTLLGLPSSFSPTALKQLAQVFDNTARNTYDPNPVIQSGKQVIAKTPGLSRLLKPQINTFGDERQNYNSTGLKRGFDIFLNPSTTGTYSTTTTQQKLKDLAESTGETGILPKYADKKIGNTQLTAKQYKDYQQELGNTYMSRAGGILNDSRLTDREKAAKLQSALSKIKQDLKKRY